MSAPLQSSVWSATVALTLSLATVPSLAADPVRESFDRMFNHEPSQTTPALPADAGTDPLIAAVVWPLLRSSQITVAGQARPASL